MELSKSKTIAILFLEGFVSVSLQMLMMRQLVPFVGSSVVVSSLVVGVFLAALSMGYAYGGRVKENHISKLISNLLISSVILTICLSYNLMDTIFSLLGLLIGNPLFEVSIYLVLFLSPIVFLLGQTVPLLTNFYKRNRTSEVVGDSFAINTVGSVLGSIVSSLLFFHFFGMAKTIFIDVLFLSIVILLLTTKKDLFENSIKIILILIVCLMLNVHTESNNFQKTNAYNNYKITEEVDGRYFQMNKSWSSGILKNNKNFDYIERVKKAFFEENQLNLKNKKVLVLGAGGFTLSHDKEQSETNDFIYIDIDPDIKEMAEKYFLQESINGKFIAEDARVFVNRTKETYDAVLVDLYSNKGTIPWHVLTNEFIQDVKKVTKENGVVAFNIVSDGFFADDYSKNIYNTIQNNFNYCHSHPKKLNGKTNIVYLCKNIVEEKHTIYIDDIARSALERK